jgi:hypothetical protein
VNQKPSGDGPAVTWDDAGMPVPLTLAMPTDRRDFGSDGLPLRDDARPAGVVRERPR